MGGGADASWWSEPVERPPPRDPALDAPRAVSYPGSLLSAVRQGLADPNPWGEERREPLKRDLNDPELGRRTFESSGGGPWEVSRKIGFSARAIVVIDHDSITREYQPVEIRGIAERAREKGGDVVVVARAGAAIPNCLAGYRVERFITDQDLTRALDNQTRVVGAATLYLPED